MSLKAAIAGGLGGLLFLALAGTVLAAAPPPVVINEIQYHPASDDHAEEYIELYNTGSITLDLSGWRFGDGIHYTFPVSTVITPGGYLVIGHDPATVAATYGITGVLGPFESGRLSNGGERLALEDDAGGLVDEVTYDDHHPWPEAPDGDGPSLELINPFFDNDSPCSWGSSDGLGTPGRPNSVYSADNIPPCVSDVSHTPVIPTSTQTVTVAALVSDNSPHFTVTLHYRPASASAYLTRPMTGTAAGFYTATIPPQDDGQYVQFYITARDDEGAVRTVPEGAPGHTSAETGNFVTVSYLYLVEDTPPGGSLPIYRLIMTAENWAELTSRDLYSNVLLDATFVYSREAFYNVGVRYRGESSRNVWPRPYRIKFRDEHEFEDRERVNLVSDELGREAMGHDLFRRAGLPAPDTRFVTLYVNNWREGDYLDIEQVDNDFLEAHFPDDKGGNLYRGADGADLRYRGSDPDAYRPNYLKKNNRDADDYSDIIALTDALTNSDDDHFRAAAEQVADMEEWLRWFAIQAVLDNHEGALWIGKGDDYFLYRRPSDGRFILISWDHDTLFMFADHSIWEPDWLGPESVRRILHEPVFTRWYYQNIAALAADEFSTAEMYPRIAALPAVVSDQDKDALRDFVANRIPNLLGQIPGTTLSISTNGGADIVTTADEVTLEGDCSPLRDVSVNGSTARVQYPTATTWRYTATLPTRDNVFVISDGRDTYTIAVYRDTFHGGRLTEDTTLPTSNYPYRIDETIYVPEGVTLTIEPGAELQFCSDCLIWVEPGGRLLATGTAAQPVVFTGRDGGYWGGILLDRTQEDNRIEHAIVEYTREVVENPRAHGIAAFGARVTVADSVIRHTDFSCGFVSYPWLGFYPTVYLLRNEIYDIQKDAVHVSEGYAFIQGNHIHDARYGVYPFEGIEVSDMVTPAVLLDNHIHDVTDDCLDLNHSSAFIARNVLHDCADKGISIGQPSSTTVVNNLIYSCRGQAGVPTTGAGIAVKDDAVSRIVNNTISGCQYGIRLYQAHDEYGGGRATVVNSILWGNDTDLDWDAFSTVTVTYSNLHPPSGGGTLFDVDPLFRDPAAGDYRLREDSPCLDVGSAADAPSDDLMGIPRPKGAGYDLGAYEFFEFFAAYLPTVMRND